MTPIKVYGTDWCEDTHRTRKQLLDLHVPHVYINIEKDPAARDWAVAQNHGKQKTPTVDANGTILIEPTNAAMLDVLKKQDYVKDM